MAMKLAAALVAVIGLGLVGYGIWYHSQHPARVIATGSVRVEEKRGGRMLVLKTRSLEIGTIRKQELELPNGTWIDCGGDCADAVKRGHTEFWEEQQRKAP